VEFDLAQPNFINSKTLRIKIKRRYAGICMGFGKQWPFQIDSFPLEATIPFRPSPFHPQLSRKLYKTPFGKFARSSAWPRIAVVKPSPERQCGFYRLLLTAGPAAKSTFRLRNCVVR
jgi:hypothetical protein